MGGKFFSDQGVDHRHLWSQKEKEEEIPPAVGDGKLIDQACHLTLQHHHPIYLNHLLMTMDTECQGIGTDPTGCQGMTLGLMNIIMEQSEKRASRTTLYEHQVLSVSEKKDQGKKKEIGE